MEMIRRVVFYIFFAVYIILCPLLILNSLGYIVYPFKEKLVHTGVIHLSSWPSGAQVFIEKSHYAETTPTTIRDLVPGEYSIRLELKGYHSWTQKVLVQDGKAAAFDKILLIPNDWNSKLLKSGSFKDLMPLPETDYFLLARGDQFKDLSVYDWKKETAQPFLNIERDLAGLRFSSFFFREESAAVLVLAGPLWDRKYLYAQVTGKGAEVRDISKLIPERPLTLQWDPENPDNVFALYEGHVDRLDTVTSAFYPKYVEGVRGWGIARDQIYIIDENNNVLASPIGKKDFKPAFESPELVDMLSREKDFYEIKPVAGNVVVFLGSHSSVIFAGRQPYLINEELVGVKPDSDGRLLVWTEKSIGILDRSDQDELKVSGGGFGKVRWVFGQGKDIRQCFWAHDGSHVVFRDGNNIFILESEPRGAAHLEPVTVSKENASVVYAETKGVLYYLGAQDGKLYALDIVPRKSVAQVLLMEESALGKGDQ
ncbi:MAG: PEGA domain-containing protein [Candidatus Omnitrophica bacterium]|nr:PEGA domain-containing protein [Candidatus Omnitrophota bacterium]